MNTKILFLITLFSVTVCSAQFSEQIIISTEVAQPRGVIAADLDGDNDMDVLSTSTNDAKVAWYENIDGQGNFGIQKIISQSLDDPVDIYSADLDGDNDQDILVASKGVSQYESKVVWYKNLDGFGNFSDYIIISDQIQGAIAVFAIDLDGDNDIDVLSASYYDNKIAWYENVDGQGNFGPQQIITNTAWSTRDVFAADIDGDNDIDVITTITSTDKVAWYENIDGMGNFSVEHIISSSVNGVSAIYVEDIDGDDDLDVISISGADNKIYWHENIDGQGSFTIQHIITDHLLAVIDVFAIDLDNDQDIDVISASANDDYVCWYENLDGQGNFSAEQIISMETDYPRSIYSTDIDNDGDNDVLSASYVDNKIAWYKNFVLSLTDLKYNSISIYPNPTSNSLTIKSDKLKINSIKIVDVLGKIIHIQENNLSIIDVSRINHGFFFIVLETDEGNIMKKIIKN